MTCDFTSFLTVFSVISRRCLDDNERLCAMEEKISPRVRIEFGPLDQ